jgi:membrane-bound serine protease (ClpP class)
MLPLLFLLLLVNYFAGLPTVSADSPPGSVIIINFNVAVDPGSSAFVQGAVNNALNQKASAIVFVMNTPGGLLSDMINIVSYITEANQSGIPVYTFVVPNGLAASAGSYIAMASNKILMGPGSVIGPSTPIVVGGTSLEQNHTQSAMLQLMVSLAQEWGRNTTAAYNMVQDDQAFSADEAFRYHVSDGFAGSLSEAISKFGLSGSQQVTFNQDLYQQFISALSNSILDGILILLGTVAIVLDVYHPTIFLSIVGGAAIIAGLIGAEVIDASVLGFFVLALAAVLIILELKLGHGFAIMGGVVLGAFGIVLLAYGIPYSPSPITSITELEIFMVIVAGIVAGLYFRWVIGPIRRRAKITGPESVVGDIGVAITDLNPEGEVRVGGIIWKAKSISGEVVKGGSVRIKSIESLTLIVEKT